MPDSSVKVEILHEIPVVLPQLTVGKTKDVKNFLKNNLETYEIVVTLHPTDVTESGMPG